MRLDAELAKLASHLDSKADTADALAREHAKALEMREAMKEENRSKNARHYADICRKSAVKLKVKEAQRGFVPPTWEELLDFVKLKHSAWPLDDVRKWFNHFESCGWVIGKDKPMRKWTNAASNGFAGWLEKNPGAKPRSVQDSLFPAAITDPVGWREFLKSVAQPYKDHRFAIPFLKSDFQKWKADR